MTIVEKLYGKRVLTKDNIDVGTISGAVMDDQWRITLLHLVLNTQTCNQLGHIKPLVGHVTLCLPVQIIENRNDAIHLDKIFEELKVLPECKTH